MREVQARWFPDAIGCFRYGRPPELKPFIRWRARDEELNEEGDRKVVGGSENRRWKKDGESKRASEWEASSEEGKRKGEGKRLSRG